jgi:hypothetical protein
MEAVTEASKVGTMNLEIGDFLGEQESMESRARQLLSNYHYRTIVCLP